jgi:DNA-binding transcriptional LysR family regulator
MPSEGHLSLKQLRAFVAVYRLRRLAPAAAQLAVTPSEVSVLIRQCESALDTVLFDRSTRQLEPTAAAHEAIDLAESILQDVAQFGGSFREKRALRSARVHLAVTPAVASALLPSAVRRFVQTHPHIRVIDDCAPDQFVQRIVSEQVEFGIGTPERSGPEIETRTLVEDRLCLVCPDDHPLAQRLRVRWADLKDVPLIAVRPGYGVRRTIDEAAARAGVQLQISNEVGFVTSALWMTASGLGVSIWPAALLRNARQGNLVVRPMVAPVVSRSISVINKRGRPLSAACEAFVQTLADDLAQHAVA